MAESSNSPKASNTLLAPLDAARLSPEHGIFTDIKCRGLATDFFVAAANDGRAEPVLSVSFVEARRG